MKVIISITANGVVYKRDDEIDGHIIKNIVFKRDGYSGINKGLPDESHYMITLENRLTDKEVMYKVIPSSEVNELIFVEVEKEEPVDKEKVDIKRA